VQAIDVNQQTGRLHSLQVKASIAVTPGNRFTAPQCEQRILIQALNSGGVDETAHKLE
jgi:hypothetical protein